jgi:hypothetical protein
MGIKELQVVPGVGESIASDLWDVGIHKVEDLKNNDPEKLYQALNKFKGERQDPCVLYVFRCAVYFASTPADKHDPHLLKWWNWKDRVKGSSPKR